MALHDKKIDGVPQFVSYFAPVVEIMRDFGGESKPQKVFDELIKRYEIPDSFLALSNKNGGAKFNNRAHFARTYLTKEGIMTSPSRGVWGLSEEGWSVPLSDDWAAGVFRDAQAKFRAERREPAFEDETVPVGTNYWFVGAGWSEGDQTDRFLQTGIWQNGYDDKFSNLVRQMKPGDRIALKAAFTRKKDVPFENHGRTVSAMRIKAIGTITANEDDGQTVAVDWEFVDPPRDWYLYTYRTTVSRARVEEEDMARKLVAFAFVGANQDFGYFLKQAPWAERYAAEIDPISAIEAENAEVEGEDESAAELDIPRYSLDDVISDGCFIPREELAGILERLRTKKNLILQGPPGTGKTWLAKRLAKALIGRRTPLADQLRSVQFHPSLSYEDFVRGYRPSGSGLVLTDGVFLQAIEAARAQPDLPHVLIIEEINRGNPAQVFGEMLTLLENTKRSRADAMELAYRKQAGEKVWVPENLYIIGTMNIADRSLALVDLALRRRFAFVTLAPLLNQAWEEWCRERDFPDEMITLIQSRMAALNETIAEDRALGAQFRVGHSYVTPGDGDYPDPADWFAAIVETEIAPLLEEYWFDAPDRAQDAVQSLIAGL